jgi:hypothetical protein
MSCGIKVTIILIVTILFCSPCFASENSLRVFDTDYFTINLPARMRQVSSSEMPPIDDKDSHTYIFLESNKIRKKSVSLIITTEKAYNNDLKKISRYFRDSARRTKCRNHASELTETRIAGRKGYYFQKSNEGCAVTIERYWMTINGDYFFTIALVKPVKGEDAVFRSVEKEIVKIKLK